MKYYSLNETARILKITRSGVQFLIACGRLKAEKFDCNRCWKISETALREYTKSSAA